jgi:hypothetical protein
MIARYSRRFSHGMISCHPGKILSPLLLSLLVATVDSHAGGAPAAPGQAQPQAPTAAPAPSAPATARTVPAEGSWDLQDGDRVVLLGDAFFEREGNYGFIETRLATAFSQRNVIFRNLAWSGDTPRCEARSYFGPPEEGFGRLKGHLELVRPNVVLACYGSASVMEGEKGIAPFIDSYRKLLDMVQQTTGAAVVLVSPPPAEEKGATAAAMQQRNLLTRSYAEAVRKLASERKLRFVDVGPAISGILKQHAATLTTNGVHFTEEGYRQIAPAVVAAMGMRQQGAAPEKLRSLIRAKNQMFFHRWRPQNETYLFGFRKHEQGNNSVEIPQFDPLIADKEKEIAAVRAQAVEP